MKYVLIAAILSSFVCVLPTQAAPGSKTRRWEKMFFPALKKDLCGPKGRMLKPFRITSAQCRKTYRYAARHCRRAAHRVPFYRVSNASLGTSWGRWLGTCIGTAFDMKHTYKMRSIP